MGVSGCWVGGSTLTACRLHRGSGAANTPCVCRCAGAAGERAARGAPKLAGKDKDTRWASRTATNSKAPLAPLARLLAWGRASRGDGPATPAPPTAAPTQAWRPGGLGWSALQEEDSPRQHRHAGQGKMRALAPALLSSRTARQQAAAGSPSRVRVQATRALAPRKLCAASVTAPAKWRCVSCCPSAEPQPPAEAAGAQGPGGRRVRKGAVPSAHLPRRAAALAAAARVPLALPHHRHGGPDHTSTAERTPPR